MTERLLFPDWPQGGVDRPTVGFEKSLTRQSDLAASDINNIVERFTETGLPLMQGEPIFADVSTVGSWMEVQARLKDAEALFMKQPVKVRERFANDPVQFLDFLGNLEANRAEAEALGLVEKVVDSGASSTTVAAGEAAKAQS